MLSWSRAEPDVSRTSVLSALEKRVRGLNLVVSIKVVQVPVCSQAWARPGG